MNFIITQLKNLHNYFILIAIVSTVQIYKYIKIINDMFVFFFQLQMFDAIKFDRELESHDHSIENLKSFDCIAWKKGAEFDFF